MAKERLKITQPLCVTAKFMLDRGGTVTETAQLLGISQSTLSRIQAADFDAEKYAAQLEARRAEEQKKREIETRLKNSAPEIQENYGKPIPGFEKPAEEQEQGNGKTAAQAIGEMWAKAAPVQIPGQLQMEFPPAEGLQKDDNKIMRFQAAMTEKILIKMDQLNDTLFQLIRCVRKE